MNVWRHILIVLITLVLTAHTEYSCLWVDTGMVVMQYSAQGIPDHSWHWVLSQSEASNLCIGKSECSIVCHGPPTPRQWASLPVTQAQCQPPLSDLPPPLVTLRHVLFLSPLGHWGLCGCFVANERLRMGNAGHYILLLGSPQNINRRIAFCIGFSLPGY